MQKSKLFLILVFTFFSFVFDAIASETNGAIVSGGNNGYAWSNQVGWVNFGATNGSIGITDSGITGYAWNSNYGWINMAPTNGGVTVATSGALSGYAWGSGLGRVNFSGVSINSSGRFIGTASGTNIGTLTFDCANCSVQTDYRPQNFRTPITTTPISGAGGAVNLGFLSATPSSHIDAFNVPLEISSSQSGTFSQGFANNASIAINIPQGAFEGDGLYITADARSLDPAILLRQDINIISNTLFDVIVRNKNGESVNSFLKPIQIALIVPEQLQNRTDLGVYFFNERIRMWEKVPNVEFDNNFARFFVDHLTLFSIFSGLDLPQFLTSLFSVPEERIISSGEEVATPATAGIAEIEKKKEIGVFEGGAPEEIKEEVLPAQLFDINLEIENTKITDVKELIARLIFTSFGRVPTPVDLTFDILGESGEKIYSKMDKITVQTQAVLTERFADIDKILERGNYTLLVKTLYNVSVVDEFKQNFEIVAPEEIKKPFWKSIWFWIISAIILVAVFIIIISKMRNDEQ